MKDVYGRPVGLWAIAFVIAADAISLFSASIDLVLSAPEEWLAIVASAAVGALLLFKAYRLLHFHHTTRVLVIAAGAIGGVTHLLEIIRGHGDPGTWLAITWAVVTIVYLSLPSVREQFVRDQASPTLSSGRRFRRVPRPRRERGVTEAQPQ